ncbi:hypothetical protein D3C76_1672270 [compost metagenome]
MADDLRRVDDGHERLHGFVIRHLRQAEIHRLALATGDGRYFQVLGLVQQSMLDLRIHPAKTFQVDPDVVCQVNITNQEVERL